MLNRILAGLAGAAIGVCSVPAASAAGDVYLDPIPSLYSAPPLAAPTFFDGAYVGASFGLQVNHFGTFYGVGTNYRIPGGVFAGYNYQVNPNVIIGGEIQADAAYGPWTATGGYSLFGLGHMGFLTAPDFMVYQSAGLGLIDGTPAFALGIGIDQAVTDNLSLRFESLAYGQLPAATVGTYYGGFTSLELAAGAVWHFDAAGAPAGGWRSDFATGAPTDFAGPYAGFYAGGIINPTYNFFFGNRLNGWHLSHFTQGGILGYNMDLGGMFRVGAEAQAGVEFDTSGDVGIEGQMLARAGVVPLEGVMVYGTTGVGLLATRPAFTVGGGIEYALWGDASLRFDGMAMQEIAPRGPIVTPGFSAQKYTVGSIWHFD